MAKFRLFFRKLKRLKHLARLVPKPPVIAELDKLWGFSSKYTPPNKARKPKRHKKNEVKEDPLEFLNKKVEESEKEPPKPEHSEQTDNPPEEDANYELVKEREFFKESVKELRKLVYPHLDPISKRHYDEMKLIALGGKVAHNRKMPYSEFQQRQKALKRHLAKNKKLEDELGVKLGLDKKGGSRFAEIHKRWEAGNTRFRRDYREKRKHRPLFDSRDRDGVYRIKP